MDQSIYANAAESSVVVALMEFFSLRKLDMFAIGDFPLDEVSRWNA
jgi:hypothetical protein